MKKLYIVLLAILFLQNKAQHTLTAAFNPAIGDIESSISLDSTGLFIGNSGTSQIWNYTNITTGTNTPYSYTYVPISSVPNNNLYPSGTIGRLIGAGGFAGVYGNTISKIEFQGFAQPTASNCQVYSDPAIFYPLPFTYGSLSIDTYSVTSWTGTYTGTITTLGDGTGTLLLPSGNYNNILRLTIIYDQLGGFYTIQTNYYSALSKFPLLTISSTTMGTMVDISGTINTLVATGIHNVSDINFPSFYPNPVTNGELFLKTNNTEKMTRIEITNVLGQVVLHLSSDEINRNETIKIDVNSLQKGIYFLNVLSSKGTITKKIIIE